MSPESGKKRSRNDSQETHEETLSPTIKRSKPSTINESYQIKCSVSSDKDDNKEFMKYVDCIRHSFLNQLLNVPSAINHEIGEYCIGQLVSCGNRKCDVTICLLHKDIKNPDNAEWIHCPKMDKYFCKECEPSVVEHECGALDMEDAADDHWLFCCRVCSVPLCTLGCDDEYKCCKCQEDGIFCMDCVNGGEVTITQCIKCRERYCDERMNDWFKDWDKICTKCNKFVCGRCVNGGWVNDQHFDADFDEFHCLEENEKKEKPELLDFIHSIDPKVHPSYKHFYPDSQ